MRPRICVTGVGAITSVGVGREEMWKNLLEGQCGIGEVEHFDTSRYKVHKSGEVKQVDPGEFVERLDPNEIGRASQLAIAAARLALEDAALDLNRFESHRLGVSLGTTSGEPQVIERFNDAVVDEDPEAIEPRFVSMYPGNVLSANVASEFGLEGANIVVPTACAAGNYAIAYAYDTLSMSRADVMLAGGADCFSRITFTGFARLGAIAPEQCQPFDRGRKGMIPGEGAAILILERLEDALGRDATIYAEISGYGLSCDAHHMTASHPEGLGAARAMEKALESSNMRAEEVSYISAHGTGTPKNDRLETVAVKRVFGDTAYDVPISSIKSMLGHTMGAASAIEAGICALAVKNNVIPPTINLETPDPECDLDYVPNSAREHRVDAAMNNAYAFGGNNSSLVFKKVEV